MVVTGEGTFGSHKRLWKHTGALIFFTSWISLSIQIVFPSAPSPTVYVLNDTTHATSSLDSNPKIL